MITILHLAPGTWEWCMTDKSTCNKLTEPSRIEVQINSTIQFDIHPDFAGNPETVLYVWKVK